MSQVSPPEQPPTGAGAAERARSFGAVADAYDRARPGYPAEAVDWLVGPAPAVVVELGAGTGKLTERVERAGHHVVATDPSPEMLRHLARRTSAPHVVATAEQVPAPSRSVDVVLCGQSFHWFAHDEALREIARVLRPGGVLAVVWNSYDDGVPWVRRLHRLLSPAPGTSADATAALVATPHFGFVDERRFRTWQHHTAATLADLARSTSHVATQPDTERERTMAAVRALYDDYGRGPDGMKVPYVTECFRAVVRHQEEPPVVPVRDRPDPARRDAEDQPDQQAEQQDAPGTRRPPEDPGVQLIDFR